MGGLPPPQTAVIRARSRSSRWRGACCEPRACARSPLFISVISQVVVPLGLCSIFQAARGLQPSDIWLAIVVGHFTRAALSVMRFRQEKWRNIAVDIEPARP